MLTPNSQEFWKQTSKAICHPKQNSKTFPNRGILAEQVAIFPPQKPAQQNCSLLTSCRTSNPIIKQVPRHSLKETTSIQCH